MKKTYRMYRMYRKLNKTKNMRKKHKTRKILRGGDYTYNIDYCSDSKNVFVTKKIDPLTLYKIDLESKTFNKFKSDGNDNSGYDLIKKNDQNLFKMLSEKKRSDQKFDDLLIRYGVNDIEYYPYSPFYISERKIHKPEVYVSHGKINKTKKYKPILYDIEEIDEDVSEHSDKNSPHRNRRKESIVAAMQFANVASSATGSKKLRVKLQNRSPSTNLAVPVLRLPSRLPSNSKRPVFKP